MADRYGERYRGEQYRDERGYGREERGFVERAGDQVRSWFGDEEAERRRRLDERERERERYRERPFGRDYGPAPEYGGATERAWSERGYGYPGGWGSERSRTGERWTGEYGTRSGGSYTGAPGTTSQGYTRPYAGGLRDFRGRGPKGYQRSDARINEDVCDRLCDAPDIDASNIEVRVNNGEVTLSGTVPERDDKRRSEDLIENISGVREVHNNLRVSGWQEGPTSTAAGTGAAATGETTGTTKR